MLFRSQELLDVYSSQFTTEINPDSEILDSIDDDPEKAAVAQPDGNEVDQVAVSVNSENVERIKSINDLTNGNESLEGIV